MTDLRWIRIDTVEGSITYRRLTEILTINKGKGDDFYTLVFSVTNDEGNIELREWRAKSWQVQDSPLQKGMFG